MCSTLTEWLCFQLPVGQRVMRGPGWEWDSQDGGAGKQGVIVEHESDTWTKVKWDYDGSVKSYKNGKNGVVDLIPAGASGGASAPTAAAAAYTVAGVSSQSTASLSAAAACLPAAHTPAAVPCDYYTSV